MASISNIFIDQGATFTTTLTINDANGSALDLTGYTAIAQIRKSPSSSTSVSFTATFVSPRTTGQITISLTDTQTTALEAGRYNNTNTIKYNSWFSVTRKPTTSCQSHGARPQGGYWCIWCFTE